MSQTADLKIRPATPADHAAIWAILHPVFSSGRTYAIDPQIREADALRYWTGGTHSAFVAEAGDTILGTYYIRPNQGGNGDHICNCGYITAPDAQGKGLARSMLAQSLTQARAMGFTAMQYNFVLANNARALDTWHRAGFREIGRIPDAFRHPDDGLIDACILYMPLTPPR